MSKNRQNEYFVPRDGIDREVITADICRYLGNDALVRPGTYDSPQTGQIIQGYFINAYRNLTTAMIEDLKADSARWEQERRQQSARSSAGGTIASRNSNGVYSRNSNSPIVQYRNSETHNTRQAYGPTEDSMRDPYGDAPRYPGSGAISGSGNYSGASNSAPAQQYSQGGYGGQPSYTTPVPQYGSQPPAMTYSTGHPTMASGGYSAAGSQAPFSSPVHSMAQSGSYGAQDPYSSRGIPVSSSSQSSYPATSSNVPQGYPAGLSGGSYYTTPSASVAVQNVDPGYGRVPPAGPTYEPRQSRTPTEAAAIAQIPSTSSSSRRHERDSVDRHADPSRSSHSHRSHRR